MASVMTDARKLALTYHVTFKMCIIILQRSKPKL